MRVLLLVAAFALLAGEAAAQPSSSSPPADRGNERPITSAVSYVPLPTLSAGVMSRTAANSGTLLVDVGLDVPDAALRQRATNAGPRMRDALRTALATYANTYYRPDTAPDPETLGRLMQAAVDRTLGTSGARLLLANVIYQRRN